MGAQTTCQSTRSMNFKANIHARGKAAAVMAKLVMLDALKYGELLCWRTNKKTAYFSDQ